MTWRVVSPKVDKLRTRVMRTRGRAIRKQLPRWRGFRARRYGPNAKHTIPRMPYLYWKMEGRYMFWWVGR